MSQNTQEYAALLEIVTTLRAPGGCPWDREQTHLTLTECLVEECSELIEAIDRQDEPHMIEELGDVLLNVVMQTEIAREAGKFDMERVCRDIREKLIRRHPHVFEKDRVQADSADEVVKNWEQIKASEKRPSAESASENPLPFKSLPPRIPSLLFAKKTFKQIQKAGMENRAEIPARQIKAMAEEWTEEQLAETLFSIAAASRLKNLDPEQLTRAYTQGLVDRLSNGQSQSVS